MIFKKSLIYTLILSLMVSACNNGVVASSAAPTSGGFIAESGHKLSAEKNNIDDAEQNSDKLTSFTTESASGEFILASDVILWLDDNKHLKILRSNHHIDENNESEINSLLKASQSQFTPLLNEEVAKKVLLESNVYFKTTNNTVYSYSLKDQNLRLVANEVVDIYSVDGESCLGLRLVSTTGFELFNLEDPQNNKKIMSIDHGVDYLSQEGYLYETESGINVAIIGSGVKLNEDGEEEKISTIRNYICSEGSSCQAEKLIRVTPSSYILTTQATNNDQKIFDSYADESGLPRENVSNKTLEVLKKDGLNLGGVLVPMIVAVVIGVSTSVGGRLLYRRQKENLAINNVELHKEQKKNYDGRLSGLVNGNRLRFADMNVANNMGDGKVYQFNSEAAALEAIRKYSPSYTDAVSKSLLERTDKSKAIADTRKAIDRLLFSSDGTAEGSKNFEFIQNVSPGEIDIDVMKNRFSKKPKNVLINEALFQLKLSNEKLSDFKPNDIPKEIIHEYITKNNLSKSSDLVIKEIKEELEKNRETWISKASDVTMVNMSRTQPAFLKGTELVKFLSFLNDNIFATSSAELKTRVLHEVSLKFRKMNLNELKQYATKEFFITAESLKQSENYLTGKTSALDSGWKSFVISTVISGFATYKLISYVTRDIDGFSNFVEVNDSACEKHKICALAEIYLNGRGLGKESMLNNGYVRQIYTPSAKLAVYQMTNNLSCSKITQLYPVFKNYLVSVKVSGDLANDSSDANALIKSPIPVVDANGNYCGMSSYKELYPFIHSV